MNDQKLKDLEERLDRHEERIRELEKDADDSLSLEIELSMPEFVNNECGASTHQERVISIAYYMKAYENQDSFTKNDFE